MELPFLFGGTQHDGLVGSLQPGPGGGEGQDQPRIGGDVIDVREGGGRATGVADVHGGGELGDHVRVERLGDFLAQLLGIRGALGRAGHGGHVRAQGGGVEELSGEPHQEVVAGGRGQAARQVQGAALGGGHRVPPAPRHVQHVPGLQGDFGERWPFGLLGRFDVHAERVPTGGPAQVPPRWAC
ncbi:hypothetical protein SSAG_00763 [Streptomyces sp. Mg1]|nr:hypothetical protein [Streptomyces sp. Mg1]AKL70628.1 hypothetical protein M444_35035 [Streptomyces sp. Mg1]EDX20972.1 hypothetical protein SSAG_00763 [Streptomyces sp. Mg1]